MLPLATSAESRQPVEGKNRTSASRLQGKQVLAPQTPPSLLLPEPQGPISLTFAWQLSGSAVKVHANPSSVPHLNS